MRPIFIVSLCSHGTKASLDKIGKVIIKGVGAEDEAERREELTEWRFAFY